MLKVLKDKLILSSSPWFIGTLCFKLEGNSINSPAVQGNKNVIQDIKIKNLAGDYMLYAGGDNYTMNISGIGSKQKASIKKGEKKLSTKN